MTRFDADLAQAAEALIAAEIACQELRPDQRMTLLTTVITHGETGALLTVTYRVDAPGHTGRVWTATYSLDRSPAPAPV